MAFTFTSMLALTLLIASILYGSCFKLGYSAKYELHTEATPKQNCICVPFFQCSDDTGELIVDGSGLMDYRKHNSPCTGYFDVCCNLTNVNMSAMDSPEKPNGCGYFSPGLSGSSGALMFQESQTAPRVYRCGFTLIHQQVGMTVAHCLDENDVETKGTYSVQIGKTFRTVAEIVTHPRFNPGNLQNDIVLLFLTNPFILDRNIGVVCIPPPSTLLDHIRCLTTSNSYDPTVPDYLPEPESVILPIIPRESCVNSLRRTRLGVYFQLHKSFLCAGGEEGYDACGGDGGSPLLCPIPGQMGRFQQVGMISWGIGCGEGTPDVFVNVGIFREWIDGEMLKRKFDITSYRH